LVDHDSLATLLRIQQLLPLVLLDALVGEEMDVLDEEFRVACEACATLGRLDLACILSNLAGVDRDLAEQMQVLHVGLLVHLRYLEVVQLLDHVLELSHDLPDLARLLNA